MRKEEYDLQERQAAYQLIHIDGVGSRSAFELVKYAGGAKEALQLEEAEIRKLLKGSIAEKFIRGREQLMNINIEVEEKQKAFRFIPFTSSEYPDKLRNISNPPFALYVRGELPKADVPSVAIIGARACSEYGKIVAKRFGKSLGSMGVQIISGMAKGIDGIAQQGALDGGGKTFGILGSGVDVIYPPENEILYKNIIRQGGILSEYPPGMEAQSGFFPQRNRIISGLADILLVVEARKRSGTYITVTQALEQGKEVFVVPGRITDSLSEGCNFLLTQGAGTAIGPECILEELARMNSGNTYFMKRMQDMDRYRNDTGEKEQKDALTKNKRVKECHKQDENNKNDEENCRGHILNALDITPIAFDVLYRRLQEKTSVSMEELLLELTKMQMSGIVESTGNYYRLTMPL